MEKHEILQAHVLQSIGRRAWRLSLANLCWLRWKAAFILRGKFHSLWILLSICEPEPGMHVVARA